MTDSTVIILLLTVLAWLWWDSRGAAEQAITAARRYCETVGVSFLNDTVAWKKVRLQRNRAGRMQIERTYIFEFTSDIERRYHGEVVMLGKQVKSVHLDAHRIW